MKWLEVLLGVGLVTWASWPVLAGQVRRWLDEEWDGYDVLTDDHEQDAWRYGLIWSPAHRDSIATEVRQLNAEWRIQLAAVGVR